MAIEVFFDYTCEHSFALHRLLSVEPAQGQVTWRTFSLKQLRAAPQETSILTKPEESFSVLALTLAHAMDDDRFPAYHSEVFKRVHEDHQEMTTQDLLGVAGMSQEAFRSRRQELIDRLVSDHVAARDRGAHGTPTIVFGESASAYFKFRPGEFPKSGALDLIESIGGAPWLLEAKRSG